MVHCQILDFLHDIEAWKTEYEQPTGSYDRQGCWIWNQVSQLREGYGLCSEFIIRASIGMVMVLQLVILCLGDSPEYQGPNFPRDLKIKIRAQQFLRWATVCHIRQAEKWGLLCPFPWGGAVSPSNFPLYRQLDDLDSPTHQVQVQGDVS